MGMAASQARFLGLTARRSNVEFEGQQINQQRTALSNQSANYYNDLLGMSVPVPPSIDDYTKTVYTFTDGSLSNTITSLIARPDGSYKASYVSEWSEDYAVVSAGRTSIVNAQPLATQQKRRSVTPEPDFTFYVGSQTLRPLGDGIITANTGIRDNGGTYRLDETNSYINENGEKITLVPADYDKIVSIIGPEPVFDDYSMQGLVANYKNTQCYSLVYDDPVHKSGHIEHNLCKLLWDPDLASQTITSSKGVTLTNNRGVGLTSLCTSWGAANYPDTTTSLIKEKLQTLWPEIYQEMTDIYVDLAQYMHKNPSPDAGYYIQAYELSETEYDENAITIESLEDRWEEFWSKVENLKPENLYNDDHQKWQEEYDKYTNKWFNSEDYTDQYDMGWARFYDGNDEYLSSLSSDQLDDLYDEENYWAERLDRDFADPEHGWYVRYVKNSGTGAYEPLFYNGDDLYDSCRNFNGDIYSHVSSYTIGSKQCKNEVKVRDARLEKDSTGRFMNITFMDENGNSTTYALTTSITTDHDAYNDAMNNYEHDKYLYDQAINDINAKIEIVQIEDKNLELRLKQLDTEHNAIQTEMDAVSKVIEKNVESSFKTFG